jgi:hypothetical protein
MTLGGLAIAIGVVVDDAVIDVENILRRLRENANRGKMRPVARVILDACLEVRGAVVYATFAVILVAVPVVALPGLAGRLFGPLAVAYALAVLASLRDAGLGNDASCPSGHEIIGGTSNYALVERSLLGFAARHRASPALRDHGSCCHHRPWLGDAAILWRQLHPRTQGRPLYRSHVGGTRHFAR